MCVDDSHTGWDSSFHFPVVISNEHERENSFERERERKAKTNTGRKKEGFKWGKSSSLSSQRGVRGELWVKMRHHYATHQMPHRERAKLFSLLLKTEAPSC